MLKPASAVWYCACATVRLRGLLCTRGAVGTDVLEPVWIVICQSWRWGDMLVGTADLVAFIAIA